MLRTSKNGSFVIRILDQQHSSWQGTITWLSNEETRPFRSTMELLFMVDSALNEDSGDKVMQPP